MNKDQHEATKLHELLNAPKVPEDLAEKLKYNMERQMGESEQPDNKPKQHKPLWYGLAASLALAAVVAVQLQSNPDLVSLAYTHAQEEAHLEGAIDGGYQAWFEAADLQLPSAANRIALSKNCALGALKAKHLRFVLPNHGTINLFLYKNGDKLPTLAQTDGKIDNQSWLSDSPRNDIRLLALYDANVSKEQITKIIQSMFKGPSAYLLG